MDLKVYMDRPFAPTHGAAAVACTAHTLSKVYAAVLPLHVSIGGYSRPFRAYCALYHCTHNTALESLK